MRVLHIEDDLMVARSVELMLKSEGFVVEVAENGEEGVDLARVYAYDLVLLDLNLPDISGIEVLRQLRVGKINTPVMILTGSTDMAQKLAAFGSGADDYLTKPVHKDELIARCHALIRRSQGHAKAVIEVGPIAVDLDNKIVSVNGAPVYLTGKEYQIVELLALRLGTTITKNQILDHLYGGRDAPEIKIVDVFVCKIRTKLRKVGAAGHLRTIWGRGYSMSEIAGDDRQQKVGTAASLVGRTLGALADGHPHPVTDVATRLKVKRGPVLSTFQRLRTRGWVTMHGDPHNAEWRITKSGLAEHHSRAALDRAA